MSIRTRQVQNVLRQVYVLLVGLTAIGASLSPLDALALPAFARQTGQNCVACHAGGQFPELTPFGRMFKLTGYTMGARALPLSVMGVINAASVADTTKSDDPAADFQKNGSVVFASGSLFIAYMDAPCFASHIANVGESERLQPYIRT